MIRPLLAVRPLFGTPLRLVRNYYFANATYTTPAVFYGPDGVTPNKAFVEMIGGGGGSLLNTGGAGGGEYRASLLTLSPSTGYAVVVGAGGAINTNGNASTFNSTDVVANPGLSTANGGTGGSGGTGTIGHNGGTGTAGTGNKAGGAAGGSVSAASGVTPGENEPGITISSSIRPYGPGGGASSQTAVSNVGAAGMGAVNYYVLATAGFPRRTGQSWGRDTAAGTTRNATMPAGAVGDIIVIFVAAPSATVAITMTGYTAFAAGTSTNTTGRFFWRTATSVSSDPVAIDTDASLQCDWIVHRYDDAGTPTQATPAGSATQNPDTPSISFASGNYCVLSGVAMSGTSILTFTGQPSGYDNAIILGRQSTSGISIATSEKTVTGTSEDPGAWATDASLANARFTVAIPFA